ncbi:dihydrofolate reductase [Symbiobacterium terraclitae]|uniref:Dihydrofolate reductase n=1 Tax=Symbiobacterium terraclitae TaxID=557451 RepID=A0ABS4JS70_9FIRM|nr:dihydrofolate reductase [Symbiobacterium terraclitae]MBP2018386.1 dihydrofolate reductase [Symbiobacterium terraclitae]
MIILIAAMDRNRVIGRDGRMPWRLPAEMRHFRRTTMGHVVVMGRRTYESIGGPLKGRTNIVLTRDRSFRAPGCEVRHSVAEVLADPRPLFVIGGAELYRQFLPHADEMILTRIDHEFQGDTFFPAWEASEWELVEATPHPRDDENPYDFVIERYRRAAHQGRPVRAD